IDVTVANHLFFEEDELEIEVGDSAELELVLWTPEGEENVAAHAVRYNSHNSDIATVDGEGKVTGKKLGVANIAVTVKEDLTLTAKLEVQVTKSERVDSSG